MVKPDHRPTTLPSVTKEKITGCGKLYVTVSFTVKEGKVAIFEVFTQMGKAGGCASSQSEMGGRLLSTALRSGVEVDELAKQLVGIGCNVPRGHGENEILSCADAIGKVLREVESMIPRIDDFVRNVCSIDAA